MPPQARNPADIFAAIARGEIAPVYCLTGAERYLVDRCVAALKTAVFGPSTKGPSFNLDVFDVKESGLGAAIETARTMPMFAKRRLVIARGVDLLLRKSEDGPDERSAEKLGPLKAYVADPNPSTCLVLTTEKADKVDGRLAAFAAIKKAGWLHEFGRLKGRDVAAWLSREAQQRGIKIAGDAVTALADAVGSDLGRLVQALDQVALLAGQAGPVTRAHVEALIPESRERELWELTDALGEANRGKALRILGALLRDGEPALRIQGTLIRQWRQLWRAREMAAAGASAAEMAPALGVPPFVVDRLVSSARRLSPVALRRGYERLYQADKALKGSRVDEHVLVQRLVQGLIDDAAASDRGISRGR